MLRNFEAFMECVLLTRRTYIHANKLHRTTGDPGL